MNQKSQRLFLAIICSSVCCLADEPTAPDYNTKIAPLLRKYCSACHNDDDREGGLSIESYAAILRGGKRGAVVAPKRGQQSRLIRVLTGQSNPAMPPDDSEPPRADEIALLRAWIDAGAKGPEGGEPDPTILVTPKIKLSVEPRKSINAIALSAGGDRLVVARYGEAELRKLDGESLHRFGDHRGNVNDVAFSRNGEFLFTAAGEAGLFGEAQVFDVASGKLVKKLQGHRDSLYAVDVSPDGRLLATASYDRTVMLWDVAAGKQLRTIAGHNGAVYDVAFHPGGKILATASGDRTVKLWDVATGRRLDTLGQSLKEIYALAFSPDGQRLVAGGVDNRIRLWQISKTGKEGTNPLLHSIFAHDEPILRLAYSADGQMLVSTGEDRMVKVWNARNMTLRTTLERQSDWSTGLALARDSGKIFVGRLDGSTGQYELSGKSIELSGLAQSVSEVPPTAAFSVQPTIDKLPRVAEVEPNNTFEKPTPLTIPIVATGQIFSDSGKGDTDLFEFAAKADEQWIIETNAARSKSPLDTKIEILHANGNPVARVLLRAVRDSEITFRGINSEQLNCRVTNWEEMELDQLIYIGGEVVKLYRAPRGPDSGFNFYPNTGKRYCYFDTSARAHALGEPCYVVEPFAVGSTFPENGLPIFSLNYENDDEDRQTYGKDSKLTFTAPSDGKYLVRVSDIRGLSGESFTYELIIRRPQADFKVTLHGANPTVSAGSGKEFRLQAERLDNFNGPIRIDITGLPPGFSATTPLMIQAGHIEAWGVINAHPDAPKPTEENWAKTKVIATADIGGKQVSHDVNHHGTIKLADKPKLLAYLELSTATSASAGKAVDQQDKASDSWEFPPTPELVIAPGESVTCKLRIERNGFKDRVQFDVNNLPHGVIVEDIGLSGVLIPEGQTERTVYLRAAPWVPETSRLFHAVAKVEGNQVTLPMRLNVRSSQVSSKR